MSQIRVTDDVNQPSNDDTGVNGTSLQKEASANSNEHGEFSSRWAFWCAAVGCAVGFGNVWRFPYLCYQHGGLAFFLPYVFGLITVVWPVFTLEMGLGQFARGGGIKAFSSLGRRCRAFGMTVFTSFNICTYYPLLLVWTSLYFIYSFKSPLPWMLQDDERAFCQSMTDPFQCSATDLCEFNTLRNECVGDLLVRVRQFFRETCFAFDDFEGGDHRLGMIGMSGSLVATHFVTWFINFMGLVAGAKILGYVSYFTMTMPTIFLIILVIVGATLNGSSLGIKQYVARFQFSEISGTDAWMNAIGQGVFSVGVAQGTGVAFSAHTPKNQNFTQDSLVVIIADTVFAFLAGFSVFSVIGYLATEAGKTFQELPVRGISLAFSTYPVGLGMVGGFWANLLCVLFFLTLWSIGMSTLIGLTEAQVLVVVDSRLGKRFGVKRWHATLALCLFFFILPGLLLSTNLGYAFLDSIDVYSSSVAQAFGAGCQALGVGWIYLGDKVIARIGLPAYAIHFVSWYLGTALLGILFATTKAAIAFPVAVVIMFGGMAVAYFLCHKSDPDGREYTAVDKLYYMTIFQVEPLRKHFNDVACQDSRIFRLGITWIVLIKYAAPTIVMFLFFSSICNPAIMYQRPSSDTLDVLPYPWYVFFVGQLGPFGLVILGIIIFAIFPDWMIHLLPPGQEDVPVMAAELVGAVDRPGHENIEKFLPVDEIPTTRDASRDASGFKS